MSDRRVIDATTIAAIAVVVYCGANVLHEGIGHGSACLVAGGRPVAMSALWFDCDGLSPAGHRIESAGGSVANLLGVAIGLGVLRLAVAPVRRYAAWLWVMVNGLQASGYLLFSGLLGVADWARVVEGVPYARIPLALVGGAAYLGLARWGLRALLPLTGGRLTRIGAGRALMQLPYAVGG
ncbi:MAG: hypothetical protein ABMB14_24040, partial [Myxococcota bacterium]